MQSIRHFLVSTSMRKISPKSKNKLKLLQPHSHNTTFLPSFVFSISPRDMWLLHTWVGFTTSPGMLNAFDTRIITQKECVLYSVRMNSFEPISRTRRTKSGHLTLRDSRRELFTNFLTTASVIPRAQDESVSRAPSLRRILNHSGILWRRNKLMSFPVRTEYLAVLLLISGIIYEVVAEVDAIGKRNL